MEKYKKPISIAMSIFCAFVALFLVILWLYGVYTTKDPTLHCECDQCQTVLACAVLFFPAVLSVNSIVDQIRSIMAWCRPNQPPVEP